MAGEQSIQLINALAFAKGTQEPTNRDVLWIDDNIEGSIYTKLKLFNTSSGLWEIISRSNIQLLNDLKTVDGAGSGLDADTLQGYTPAQLMSSGGGGGSVPDLFTGQILVGQGDTIGTAQTVGGIATIDTSGNLIYIPGTISHADLADIGTFTHAQIDSHINDTANPHGVTASQVGNTTAQWNANSIEGNLTNLGTLGSSEDGYAVVWDNATSRFITAPSGGNNISNADLTWTGDTIQDLDGNSLTFQNGGNVTINNTLIDPEGFIGNTSFAGNNLMNLSNTSGNRKLNASGNSINITFPEFIFQYNSIASNYFKIRAGLNTGWVLGNFEHHRVNPNGKSFFNASANSNKAVIFGDTDVIGTELVSLRGGATAIQGAGTSTGTTLVLYDNDTTPNKTWEWLDSGDVNVGQDSTVNLGSNDLTFDGVVKIGDNGTGLNLITSDETNPSLNNFRIQGNSNYTLGNYLEFWGSGSAEGFSTRIGIQSSASNGRFNVYDHTTSTEILTLSNALLNIEPNVNINNDLELGDSGTNSAKLGSNMAFNGAGVFRISLDNGYTTGNYIEFGGTGSSDGFSTRIGIQGAGASNRRFNIYNHNGNYEMYEANGFSGANIFRGKGTSTGTIISAVDNSDTERFKVLDNGNIFTNGNQGFTGTGAYTNFTIENGIITAAS